MTLHLVRAASHSEVFKSRVDTATAMVRGGVAYRREHRFERQGRSVVRKLCRVHVSIVLRGRDRGYGVFSEWRKWAACRGASEPFFSYDEETVARARAICEGCPVRKECLRTALADPRLTGVWGATTEAQRDRIRRQRVA